MHRAITILVTTGAVTALTTGAALSSSSAASPTSGAAAPAPVYLPAGAQGPQGPTDQWHLPYLTSFKVGSTTRLVRSVTYSTIDGGTAGANDVKGGITQYLDLGSGRDWATISGPAGLSMANTVTAVDPATGRTAINTVVPAGIHSGVPWLAVYWSTDAKTWPFRHNAPVKLGSVRLAEGTAFFPYQGVITLPDKSWLMPAYYTRCLTSAPCTLTQGKSTVGLVVSIDQGKTWTLANQPFATATGNYSEASVIRQNSSGRLTMVARYDRDPLKPFLGSLTWRESTRAVNRAYDVFNLSWNAPSVRIPGRQVINGLNEGSSPRLTRVYGNKIMLTFGRPGSVIVWNLDGTAKTWRDTSTLYGLPYPHRNTPTSCTETRDHPFYGRQGTVKVADVPCHAMGTSGYLGVTVVDGPGGIGYVTGDTCHVWSCEPASNPVSGGKPPWGDVNWTVSEPYRQQVWMVRFDS